MGRDTEAIELYRQAIALKEKTLGAKHPSLALTLSNLSYLYTDRRDIATGRGALDARACRSRKRRPAPRTWTWPTASSVSAARRPRVATPKTRVAR